jgi:HlyD family secretion protein
MRPPKLAQRGPRRPNDLDTLEVMIDVAPGSALMPGMRVDAFFKIEGASTETPRAEAPRGADAAVKPN